MPIAGEWRAGSPEQTAGDHDPYTAATPTEIRPATVADVDRAHAAAERAWPAWAAEPPARGAEVMDAASFGKLLHRGQICIAINRIIVDGWVHDALVERSLSGRVAAGGPPAIPTR